ncbi:hypothetical protein TNIN_462761 [Trichonephila inaurata madagascariensis]|uniref:Endonuclease/exonuclease/phosphatase domain-containing protein n=1 Tax=Trichonephila inaurata madagascariensis TaxID=2747483 RepID=A0A8X6X8V8_9ARAC|nr:hypothetical protein TNIN_462761 [Trichonephila inaurata madagascariensis]
MQDNTFEIVELNLWKGNTRIKFIFAYNPPGNPPLTHILESSLDRNTIIIGDFNSQPRWGYRDINPEGRIMWRISLIPHQVVGILQWPWAKNPLVKRSKEDISSNLTALPRWNFKKADWIKFSDLTNFLLIQDIMDRSKSR